MKGAVPALGKTFIKKTSTNECQTHFLLLRNEKLCLMQARPPSRPPSLKGIDGIKKHEAWMEVALKENYSNQNSNIKENRLFTEDFVRRHNWSDIKITQSYCTHPPSCKDYSFKLPPEDFRGMLAECYEQYRPN